MSGINRVLQVLCVATAVLCIVCSTTAAHSQDKGIKVAVVNPSRVISDYKYTKESDSNLKKKQNDIVTALNCWDQNRYLSESDQRALGDIAIKDSNKVDLTAADKATKTKLEETSKRLFDEQLALQTKQSPTEDERNRLKELSRLEQDTGKRIKERQASAQTELQKEASDIRQKIDTDVRAMIEKVSKEKGFNAVFSSEVLLYCDSDITDEVVKRLNK